MARMSFRAALTVGLSLTALTAAQATPADDRYVAGYVTAIVERELQLGNARITVTDGVVTISAPQLGGPMVDRLRQALAGVSGIRRVDIVGAPAAPVIAAPAELPPAAQPSPTPSGGTTVAVAQGGQFLPRGSLFEALHADPRWPHFSAAYRYQAKSRDVDVDHIGGTSFGETFPLYRHPGLGGLWELQFQAAVFAIFDLGSDSADLVNADYWAGVPIVYRRGDVSTMLRVSHQSSHLGDEFIYDRDISKRERVNLSYEMVDALISYDVSRPLRIYGGGGYIFHTEPGLDRWLTQFGVEYEHKHVWASGLRPVMAADIKLREEDDWSPNISLLAGVQLENLQLPARRIWLTAEYYNGNNYNGQFYDEDLEYVGAGLHLFFY